MFIFTIEEGIRQPEGWTYILSNGHQMKIGKTKSTIKQRLTGLDDTLYRDFEFQFAIKGAHLEFELHALFDNFQCACRHKNSDRKAAESYLTRKEYIRRYKSHDFIFHYRIELFSLPYNSISVVQKLIENFIQS